MKRGKKTTFNIMRVDSKASKRENENFCFTKWAFLSLFYVNLELFFNLNSFQLCCLFVMLYWKNIKSSEKFVCFHHVHLNFLKQENSFIFLLFNCDFCTWQRKTMKFYDEKLFQLFSLLVKKSRKEVGFVFWLRFWIRR